MIQSQDNRQINSFKQIDMQKVSKMKMIPISGILVSLALIFSYVETIIPINLGVPGIKLGLANIVVLTTLYIFGPKYAIIISGLRILLNGLLFAGIFAMLYGFVGATISMLGMIVLMKSNRFSLIGVSIAGSFLHVFGQLVAAAFVFGNLTVFLYLPVLTVTSIVFGALIGFLTYVILGRITPQIHKLVL